MTKEADNSKDYTLWMLMIMTRDAVYKARERELLPYGITPEQSGALYVISNLGDNATVSKIGLHLMRQPHSVSNLLKRLVKYGLIKRQKSDSGRIPATYNLTQKGHEALEKSVICESIHKAFSALSKDELENLELYLRKIMDLTFRDMVNELKPPWP